MAKLFIEETSLVAIGDAIREKTGQVDTDRIVIHTDNVSGFTLDDWDGTPITNPNPTTELVEICYPVKIEGAKRIRMTISAFLGDALSFGNIKIVPGYYENPADLPATTGATTNHYIVYSGSGSYDKKVIEYINDSLTVRLLVSAEKDTTKYGFYAEVQGYSGTNSSAPVINISNKKTYSPAEMAEAILTLELGEGSGGITPEGELAITENGSYDVTEYASAAVNVPVGITPTGTFDITDNGIFNISQYENVNVNVATSGNGDTFQKYIGGKDSSFYYVTLDSNAMGSLYTREGAFAYDGSLRTLTANGVTRFGSYTASNCANLVEVYATDLLVADSYTLYTTPYLKVIDMPKVYQFGQSVLYGANTFGTTATKWSFPKLETMGMYSFRQANVETLDFGALLEIANYCFYYAANIKNVIIRTNSVCTLGGSSAFANSGISKGTGYIYVPAALVNDYKAASNWSQYAAQIRAIEDYPDICG